MYILPYTLRCLFSPWRIQNAASLWETQMGVRSRYPMSNMCSSAEPGVCVSALWMCEWMPLHTVSTAHLPV